MTGIKWGTTMRGLPSRRRDGYRVPRRLKKRLKAMVAAAHGWKPHRVLFARAEQPEGET